MDKQKALEHLHENKKIRPEIKRALKICFERYHEAFKNLRDR